MTREDIERAVKGYEDSYRVDIFGNVTRVKDGTEVPQHISKFGYANVMLYKNGKQKQHKVHRLIAEAFIPNPYNKPQVNHLDGNKAHNVVWNLEWSTAKENNIHASDTGLIHKADDVGNPKCNDCKFCAVCIMSAPDGSWKACKDFEPKVVRCGECIRHDNCWMFDEHKDDNGTCVWAESNNITESPNEADEKNDEVIEKMKSMQKELGVKAKFENLSKPSGDLISREEAIEAVCRTRCGDKAKGCPAHSCLVIEEFEALPSADRPTMIPIELEKRYPNSKDEDITDAFMRGYQHGRTECDRPSGEWVFDTNIPIGDGRTSAGFRCSVCGADYWHIDRMNYCPSCGARMENKE